MSPLAHMYPIKQSWQFANKKHICLNEYSRCYEKTTWIAPKDCNQELSKQPVQLRFQPMLPDTMAGGGHVVTCRAETKK